MIKLENNTKNSIIQLFVKEDTVICLKCEAKLLKCRKHRCINNTKNLPNTS